MPRGDLLEQLRAIFCTRGDPGTSPHEVPQEAARRTAEGAAEALCQLPAEALPELRRGAQDCCTSGG